MQPGTETNDPEELRRRQFIEYLQQQQLLLQQRQQQTSSLLPLLSQSDPTEGTNPSWNPLSLSSDFALSSFASSSPTSASLVPTGNLPDPQNQEYPYLQFDQEEDDLVDDDKDDDNNDGPSGLASNPYLDHMPTTSDFVKKLYRMLEEPRFQRVVCWGPMGDCFIIKDMEECTKSILPRLFRHSNFSSFVRQLNKYGFHKVKYIEGSQFGEHSWVFRHPDFRAGQPETLEKIKRKPSMRRRTVPESTAAPSTAGPSSIYLSPSTVTRPILRRQLSAPQQRIAPTAGQLIGVNQDLSDRLKTLECNQEGLLGELIIFQQGLAQRNDLIQNLIERSFQNRSANMEASLGGPSSISNSGTTTNVQAYPLTFQPPDLRLEPQQDPISSMTRHIGSASSSSSTAFRLIQPSFGSGDLLSFPPGLQSQSTSMSSRSRSQRRYSANDAEASSFSSILGCYGFDDDAEGDDH